MNDSAGFKELEDSKVGTRGRSNKQFSRVASSKEQGECLRCLLQALDNVEFSNYTPLGDPFAEISQSFRVAIYIVESTEHVSVSAAQVTLLLQEHLHDEAFDLCTLTYEVQIGREALRLGSIYDVDLSELDHTQNTARTVVGDSA